MKRLFVGLALATAIAALSGCYYDPGYRYVRGNGYAGDAYYGSGTVVYDNAYYGPGWGYYGCCYGPDVIVGGGWYHDSYRYRGRYWNGPRGWPGGPRGGWRGGPGHGGGRPGGRPAGGWHGGHGNRGSNGGH